MRKITFLLSLLLCTLTAMAQTYTYSLLYANEVEATIAGLKISDAPVDGNWAENTTWYKIQNKKESEWLSTSVAYCNTGNYLVLTNRNEPNDDYGLWCIVGDVTNGFKFYNKGEGTSKALSGSRSSNSGSASFIMSESTDVDNVKFDIANSLKAGYIIIKDHNNGNNYWNHRDNNLAYWNSAGANDDDGSSFKFYYVEPKYSPVVFASKDSRQIGLITLAGSQFGTTGINNYTLTESEKNSYYADLTESVTMYAVAGESVDLQCTTINWMHTYVYIDKDGDGFSASIDATDGYTPLEDLVSYSCYNSVQADDAASSGGTWYNSLGTNLNSNNNKQDAPNFTAPATAGTYRVRLKSDWNSIKPQGGSQFQSADGAAIDFTLIVLSTDDTEGIAQVNHLVAKNYLNSEITRIETAKNSIVPTDAIGKGCYSQAKLDEFTTYINAAKEVLANAEQKSTEELTAATTTLQQAYTVALTQFNLPVAGKLYRIKSYIKNATQESYKYHYVAANSATYTAVDAADETTVWLCQEGTTENRRKFVSYNVANKALAFLSIGATACDFEVGAGVENGTVYLKDPNNTGSQYMGFTNEAYIKNNVPVVGINSSARGTDTSNNNATWSTDFIFEELVIASDEDIAAAIAFANNLEGKAGYPVASELEAFKSIVNAENVRIDAIEAAKASLYASTNVNMPEDGKAYKIKYGVNNGNYYYLYDNGSKIAISKTANTALDDNSDIFIFRALGEGKYALVNNRGKYLVYYADGKTGAGGVTNGLADSYELGDKDAEITFKQASTVSITNGSATAEQLFGGFAMQAWNSAGDGNAMYYMLANQSSQKQFHSGSSTAFYYESALSSVFYLEEVAYANTPVLNNVTDQTLINIDGSMATFSAPFATVVPEGVTAYTATDNGNHVTLNAIEGAVPANTGVILVGATDAGKVTMKPVTTETVATVGSNALAHSAGAAIELSEGQHYLLGAVAGVPGFYLSGAGTLAMNKAYLAIPTGGNSVVVRFPGTTGIDEVERESAQDVIYDLAGRRVEAMTAPGIYIVNGKKVLVK